MALKWGKITVHIFYSTEGKTENFQNYVQFV